MNSKKRNRHTNEKGMSNLKDKSGSEKERPNVLQWETER